jgi:hypothetical protein
LALEFFSARFRAVFYVPGNHEFYRAEAPDALERIRKRVAQHPRVTLLEPGVIARWRDHRVVGATLWFREGPDHPRLASMLSDFSEISEFVPWVYEQNRQHRAWLDEVVREGDVVVTHHLPSRRSVAPRYEGDPLNVFFVCDEERLIEERRPALWVHGHTHESFRYPIGTTTVICNPLGYRDQENPAFDDGRWPRSPPGAERGPPKRILFLDDSRVRHDAFALSRGGDEILHVCTAADATRALDGGERFDLVYLDHDLAEEHYLEMSGGMRETPAPGDPPYDPGTGMDVVLHILQMPPERRPARVVVHSHNATAVEMVARLEHAGVAATWERF